MSTSQLEKKGSDLVISNFKIQIGDHFPVLGGGNSISISPKPTPKKPKFTRAEKGKWIDHVGASKETWKILGAKARSPKFKTRRPKVKWRPKKVNSTQDINPKLLKNTESGISSEKNFRSAFGLVP